MPPDSNELDINAIADSIGKDIFGSDENPGAGSGDPAPGAPQQASTPPSNTPAPAQPDEWATMPKAWKMEKKAIWDRLMADKEAREYIHAREADVVKGFEQYSTGHKNWNELISPFQPVIQQHPNVNPVQVMQNLMRNHLAILQATPEQKRVMAQAVLKSYGIDLSTPGATPANPPALPPEVQGALQTVGQLRDELGRFKANEEARALEQNRLAVEAFAKDPANKYFEEVADDILQILGTMVKPDLKQAYEQAIWTNPVVRAKIIAEQQASAPTPPKPPLNVDGTGGTPPAKPKTFEDSLDGVMTKHYGAGWKNAH